MDEENQGFAIPANKPMFDDVGDVGIEITPVPESEYFMVFTNDARDKAVILTPIEDVGGEILEKHGRPELETYAETLMDTGDDPMELQIGTTYEGQDAEAEAKAEAMRLDEEYAPEEGASDEEIIAAVNAARADAGSAATEAPEEGVTFPEDMGGDEGLDLPELPTGGEGEEVEPVDVEGEPILDQLKKRAKAGI